MHYHTCAKHESEAGEADCASCIIEYLEARISTLEDHLIFKQTEVREAEGWILKVEAERDRYREALEHIIKHIEITAGGMAPVSSVHIIATKALTR